MKPAVLPAPATLGLAVLAMGALASGAAAPAFAEGGPTQAQVKALSAAMAGAGCKIDAANQGAVLKAAGLSADEGAMTLDLMVRQHKAARTGDSAYRLEGCK